VHSRGTLCTDGEERFFMRELQEFFRNDRFATSVGIELLDIGKGRARAKLDIRPEHFNAVNIVHGAAIFTLADLVFAVASNAHGNVAVAVNANISYLKAAGAETRTLFAEATEVSRNFKLASYTVRITDERDELIAIFQGMVYRKKNKLVSTPPPPVPG
jgi:acyl-CoA thioesterase